MSLLSGAEAFAAAYGRPRRSTARTRPWARPMPDLDAALAVTGSGLFADGLLGLGSVREEHVTLEGWPVPAKEDAVPALSTAMGVVFAVGRKAIWVVDTWNGDAFDSDMTVDELLGQLATTESQEGSLDRAGFRRWLKRNRRLPDNFILQPQPLPLLGGSGALETATSADLAVHVDIVRQLL